MRKLHPNSIWFFYYRAIIRIVFTMFFALLFLMFIVLGSLGKTEIHSPNTLANVVSGALWVIIVVLLLGYVWARLYYHFYRYELTAGELKIEAGVIRKKYVTVPYDRIQNIDIYRSIVERLLGLSTIHISTAGSGYVFGEGIVPGILHADAEKLREELMQYIRQSKKSDV